jgi:hypothetical protein
VVDVSDCHGNGSVLTAPEPGSEMQTTCGAWTVLRAMPSQLLPHACTQTSDEGRETAGDSRETVAKP